jgi:hypothetical protein
VQINSTNTTYYALYIVFKAQICGHFGHICLSTKYPCSNTLSKDFVLTTNQCDKEGNLSDDCNLTEEFYMQQYSTKQALDLAVKLANLVFKKGLTDTELRVTAGEVLDACSDWNEDELEVVDATEL